LSTALGASLSRRDYVVFRSPVLVRSVRCLLFHEDFDLHRAGSLKHQREVKAVIGAERLLQTAQHDMRASRLKIEFTTAGNHHIIHAAAVGVHK
jgi:hypothetical protein